MGIGWFRAWAMRLRMVDVDEIRAAYRLVEDHGLPVTVDMLEAHYLAGGDCQRLVRAVIEARKRGLDIDIMKLTAMELSGGDLDAFIEHGGRTEEEIQRDRLRERAFEEESAAAELHAMLLADLARAEAAAGQFGGFRLALMMGGSQRRGMTAALQKFREEVQQQLSELERRWPGLAGRG